MIYPWVGMPGTESIYISTLGGSGKAVQLLRLLGLSTSETGVRPYTAIEVSRQFSPWAVGRTVTLICVTYYEITCQYDPNAKKEVNKSGPVIHPSTHQIKTGE